MDFETQVLQAVACIPRVQEAGLSPTLDDAILGGRLDMDSYDFAELVVILQTSTGRDPFAQQAPRRGQLVTLRDLARHYAASRAQ
jgi:hypothetical protein